MICSYCKGEIGKGQTIIPVQPGNGFVCSLECKGMWDRKMEQIFIQGETKTHPGRIYPTVKEDD